MATYQPLMAKQQTQRGQRVKREGCGCLVLRFSTVKRLETLGMKSLSSSVFDFSGEKRVHCWGPGGGGA